ITADQISEGTNMIYGPLLDLAPSDPVQREQSTLWRQNRIHTWRPEVAQFFARLTIDKAEQMSKKRAVFVVKHAPGYGHFMGPIETANRPPIDHRSLKEISVGLQPFRGVIDQFGPSQIAVMVSGVVVPSLGRTKKNDLKTPLLFSPRGIEWLRHQLGPMGEEVVLLADDLTAPIFLPYYRDQLGLEKGKISPHQRWRLLIQQLAASDVDLILSYESPPQERFALYLEEGKKLVEERLVSREVLEKSVYRILRMKKRLYPHHPRLQNIRNTVQLMSVEELLAQKLILPGSWINSSTTERERQIVQMTRQGIGGISFEGTQGLIRQVLKGPYSSQSKRLIPPFLANNSLQEIAGFQGRYRSYLSEVEPIRRFTELLDLYSPEPVSSETLSSMVD
ncbi:MAG: hypothetical protein Q7S00_06230, partial [bacterium]|nr:hypothetical protein [bacterium]